MREENKAVVRCFYEEFVSTGTTDGLEELIAPDYAEVVDGVRHPAGIAGAKEHITGVRRTYHDLHMVIERQIAEGEWVATCYTMHGIHAEAYGGMRPTGKPVAITGVNVDRVVDGRIVEHGGAANMLGPLLASGAVRVAD